MMEIIFKNNKHLNVFSSIKAYTKEQKYFSYKADFCFIKTSVENTKFLSVKVTDLELA